VIAELNQEGPWELVPTFLGAHAVPSEFRQNREGYLRLLIDEMLPEVSRCCLAEFCDVFCERGVFSLEESERILDRAGELGMKAKLHADEFFPLGGAELAAQMHAVSADHLLSITDAGIEALARSDTVATLLPGTAFFLGLQYAPARRLIEAGTTVALASDCNPGTCPTENLPLIGSLACTQMKMLPAEVVTALTLNATAALNRSDQLGSIEVGKQADLIVCDVPDYRQLFYNFGVGHVWRVIKRGRVVTRLEPPTPPEQSLHRADDPRLGDIVEYWCGGAPKLRPSQAVLVGFPQDEGVRRNHGRPGAAQAPLKIRQYLYRLTPWDAQHNVDLADYRPLDMGSVRIIGSLEDSQEALGVVVAGILNQGAVPVILGGGHETAYGHYLGYLPSSRPVGIINVDAHLDVRPCLDGQRGHSGSPFRQALEHPTHPLPGNRYVCLGAQPHAVSRAHWQYAQEHGCIVRWRHEVNDRLEQRFNDRLEQRFNDRLEQRFLGEVDRLSSAGCRVYVTLDADVIQLADVPGVSAPNPGGLPGGAVASLAHLAGKSPAVTSFDLVEICPPCDVNDQSSRWAALIISNFLTGLAERQAR